MKVLTMADVMPKMHLLLFGPPGGGKTTLAASAQDHPSMSNVLFIDIESGLVTVAHRGDIRFVNVKDNQDGTPCLDVVANMEKVYRNIITKAAGYEDIGTVVIDSATELQQMDLANIASIEHQKYQDAVSTGKAKNKKPVVKDRISLEYYGLNTSRMKRIFRMYRDGPFHLIVTALSRKKYESESETAPPTDIGPQLTPTFGESLMGMMDYVWYMCQDEKACYLLTAPKTPYKIKTRGPRFQDAIGSSVKNPNLPDLYEIFLKSIKDGGPNTQEK